MAPFSLDKNRSPFGFLAPKRLSNYFISRSNEAFLSKINAHIQASPLKVDMLKASVIFEIVENYLATKEAKWINLLRFFIVLDAQKKKGGEKNLCLVGK